MTTLNDANLENEESCDNLPPVNLLVAFLEFTSVVMFDLNGLCAISPNKADYWCVFKLDPTNLQTTRLCLIILTCITEDACANSILHDHNLAYTVNVHKMVAILGRAFPLNDFLPTFLANETQKSAKQ